MAVALMVMVMVVAAPAAPASFVFIMRVLVMVRLEVGVVREAVARRHGRQSRRLLQRRKRRVDRGQGRLACVRVLRRAVG